MSKFKANTLRNNINYRQKVSDNAIVLKWIREGVRLPFNNKPKSFMFHNRKFRALEAEFIDSEISQLLKSGCIVQRKDSNSSFISPINMVPKKKGFTLETFEQTYQPTVFHVRNN